MIIIADSGGTRTDWCSIDGDGVVRRVETEGLNPTGLDPEDMRAVVGRAVPVLNPSGVKVDQVYFYGAGFVSEAVSAPVAEVLDIWCPFAKIECQTDLVAAARALFGDDSEGSIAVILGTGSNSCLWKEGSIQGNIRPGGFILGDEGSGAVAGKMLLADFVKGLVPQDLERELEEEYHLDYKRVVENVYKRPAPSRYLGQFAKFLCARRGHPYVEDLLTVNFRNFIERTLVRYAPGNPVKVGVVGSFGCACSDILTSLGQEYGLDFVSFIPSPIEALISYHTNGL